MIKVRANLFKAASLCVSREETRYYLNGVYIEPCAAGGVTLTATDGHRMVCIHDKDGTCGKPAIVSVPKGALAERVPGGHVTVDDDGLFRHETFVSLKSAIIDGTFPDYRHVIRASESKGFGKSAPAVRSKYLTDFGRVASILAEQPADNQSLRIFSGPSDADPAMVQFPNSPHAFGILMPIRAKEPPAKFPWFIAGAPVIKKNNNKDEPKEEDQKAAA